MPSIPISSGSPGAPSVCVEEEPKNQVPLEHVAPHTDTKQGTGCQDERLCLCCVTNPILIIGDVLVIHINNNFGAVCENGIRSLLRNAHTGLLIAPNACKSS